MQHTSHRGREDAVRQGAGYVEDGVLTFKGVPYGATTGGENCADVRTYLSNERELTVEWDDVVPKRVLACETLTGTDLKAFNTFDTPRRVVPQAVPAPAAGDRMTLKLPPRHIPWSISASDASRPLSVETVGSRARISVGWR